MIVGLVLDAKRHESIADIAERNNHRYEMQCFPSVVMGRLTVLDPALHGSGEERREDAI